MKFASWTVFILLFMDSVLSAEHKDKKIICKTGAYSKDDDPAGTNIRDQPKGRILAQIPSGTVFSIIGYLDEWFEIKEFEYNLDSDADIEYAKKNKHKIAGDTASIPRLRGWIHRNHVTFHFGGRYDAKLYKKPDDESKVIFPIKESETESPAAVLACSDNWFKVKIKNQIGWVNSICLNTRTNCN